MRSSKYNIILVIRINVDKTNFNYLEDLVEFKDKVSVYIAPVDNFSSSCTKPDCFTMSEFSEQEVNVMEKALDKGFNLVSLPHMGPTICGSIGFNSFVIDPKGDLYKCWEHIAREEEKVGDIFGGAWNTKNLNQWLLYNAFESTECRNSVRDLCQVIQVV